MEFTDLVHVCRSVRVFEEHSVEPEKVKAILELMNQAPSAGNLQAYEVYQVTAVHPRAALAHAAEQSFIARAPLILVFFANPGRSARKYGMRGKELYALQDATIAASYAMLAATNLGLASVWVGAFNDTAVTSAVGAPGDWVPIAILPIGYAAEAPGPSSRRPLEDLVHSV